MILVKDSGYNSPRSGGAFFMPLSLPLAAKSFCVNDLLGSHWLTNQIIHRVLGPRQGAAFVINSDASPFPKDVSQIVVGDVG